LEIADPSVDESDEKPLSEVFSRAVNSIESLLCQVLEDDPRPLPSYKNICTGSERRTKVKAKRGYTKSCIKDPVIITAAIVITISGGRG
jgi:hypothetical protein